MISSLNKFFLTITLLSYSFADDSLFLHKNDDMLMYYVKVGEDLEIDCRPKNPEYEVKLLTIYIEDITNNTGILYSPDRGFTLKNMQLRDSGIYSCQIDAKNETEEKPFSITVSRNDTTMMKYDDKN